MGCKCKCYKKHHKDRVFGCKKIVGLPPCGKIAVGIGQTSDGLYNYRKSVLLEDSKAPYPYAVSLYSSLSRGFFLEGMSAINVDKNGNLLPGFLPNLNSDNYYRCGDFLEANDERNLGPLDNMMFRATLTEYPKGVLILALFMGSEENEAIKACSALYTGQNPFSISEDILEQYRKAVEVLACHLKNLDRKVLIRPMYEIDFELNEYAVDGDSSYAVNTFRYIKQQMMHYKAKNVGLMWHVAGFEWGVDGPLVYDTTKPEHYDLWYPGDQFVDWIGISYWVANDEYQLGETSLDKDVRNLVYNFARKHKKPVCYTECSLVSLYIDQDGENGSDGPYLSYWFGPPTRFPQTSEEIWENAFEYLFNEIEENRDVVRLLSYINTNWGVSVNWGDSRLQLNDYIRERFFNRITDKKYYKPCRPKFDLICEYPYCYDCEGIEAFIPFGMYYPDAVNIVDNPDPDSVNPSGKVLRFLKGGFEESGFSEVWAGAFSSLPVDLSTATTLTVDVWFTDVGDFILKLEDDVSGSGLTWEQSQPVTETNKWVTITFDLTVPDQAGSGLIAAGQIFQILVIFPYFGTTQATDRIAYIDNLIAQPGDKVVIDFESTCVLENKSTPKINKDMSTESKDLNLKVFKHGDRIPFSLSKYRK